jgi:hypothetical protein
MLNQKCGVKTNVALGGVGFLQRQSVWKCLVLCIISQQICRIYTEYAHGYFAYSAINPDQPPKIFKEAMSRSDQENWATAMNKEYLRFKDMDALAIVRPPKGARILGTLTRWEYKEENGKLVKYEVRMTIRGDQQVEGESFDSKDLSTLLF